MTHEFGKGGEEALDAEAIHFHELTGDEGFGAAVGEDGGGEDYHIILLRLGLFVEWCISYVWWAVTMVFYSDHCEGGSLVDIFFR